MTQLSSPAERGRVKPRMNIYTVLLAAAALVLAAGVGYTLWRADQLYGLSTLFDLEAPVSPQG